MTYLAFEAIGLDRIRTECSVSYLDHKPSLCRSLRLRMTIFTYSLQLSVSVFMFPDLENGICHAVQVSRFGAPGKGKHGR